MYWHGSIAIDNVELLQNNYTCNMEFNKPAALTDNHLSIVHLLLTIWMGYISPQADCVQVVTSQCCVVDPFIIFPGMTDLSLEHTWLHLPVVNASSRCRLLNCMCGASRRRNHTSLWIFSPDCVLKSEMWVSFLRGKLGRDDRPLCPEKWQQIWGTFSVARACG